MMIQSQIMRRSSGYNILIVDDISKNIEVLGTILSREGYSLGIASRGSDAIVRARSGLYDLILLDILMPEMDGFQVCIKLRSDPVTADIPVIFLSAKIDSESIVRGFEAGGQDYVTKPFNPSELIARVKTHLDLRSKKRELEELNITLEDKVAERTEELLQANRRLSVLERAKSDFLALVSHEIRTPLNAMVNLVEILNDMTCEKMQKELLADLKSSIRRFSRFSETALMITSFRANREEIRGKRVRIESLFNVIMEQHADEINAGGLRLIQNISPQDLEIDADEELFGLCLDNILHNAIKFSNKGGIIELRASHNIGSIEIEISDNGPGLSDTVLANIFDIFTAGDLTHHSDGFGLGLAASRLIVEAHGGTIAIRNSLPQGLCVILSLPIHEKAAL